MRHTRTHAIGCTIMMLLLGSGAVAAVAEETSRVLKEYVTDADDAYGWRLRQRTRLGQSDCIELTLTSQTWRGIAWKHRLFLIVPDGVKGEADALLVIEGGRWKESHAEPLSPDTPAYPKQAILLASFAQQLGSPVAVLLNVPQQPIFDGRTEDEIIAYTFDRYLESNDPTWPLLLPMVKSVVRGMDAIQAFAEQELSLKIERFTVTGASKRGWTTWLTAAADERVMALGPMVIDMLNMEAQLPHQVEAYGGYSPRIHDYTDLDLPRRMAGEAGASLRQIVDPYQYRAQLTQPKMLFLGTNDGFWTVDALNLYWDELIGPKYVVYVPNADHDLAKDWQRVFGGTRALHLHAQGKRELPGLDWEYAATERGLRLTVDPGQGETVRQVRLWSACSPTRDFREAVWTARVLEPEADDRYRVDQPRPDDGYQAIYAEVVYAREVLDLHLSTTLRLVSHPQVGMPAD